MNTQLIALRRRLGAPAASIVLAVSLCVPVSVACAQMATHATITPSLFPDRLGSRASLTYTINYTGGEFGVPRPVHRAILQFPAGLTLELPTLHSCSTERLRNLGPSGCPARSLLGSGHALAELWTGSQILTEHLRLWALLGPPQNLQPTVEILVQGYTPFDERVILTGTPFIGHSPYGEGLFIPIAAIPTLTFEPSASIATFTLTIGATRRRSHRTGAVIVPSKCPPGGFPFTAQFTYADGSTGNAFAAVRCP